VALRASYAMRARRGTRLFAANHLSGRPSHFVDMGNGERRV
jgi:hypothetical protein